MRGYLPATNENIELISTALADADFDLIKRKDTVDGEVWRLFIVSRATYRESTFAEFCLTNEFRIVTIVGSIRMMELMSIQQILHECYEKIVNRD